jgi:tetratricopeptide (TPR) repeat protein
MRPEDVITNKAYAAMAAKIYRALESGDVRGALSQAQGLVKSHGEVPELLFLLSDIMLKAGLTAQALDLAEKAYRASENELHLHAHFAQCLMRQGLFEDALREADICSAAEPENPGTQDLLGNVFTGCGELERALQAFEMAVASAPDDLHFQFNLATGFRAAGRLDEAETLYDHLISKRPDDFEAWRNRSDLRKQTLKRNHTKDLETLLPRTEGNARGAFQILGALAKEFSDLGDFEKSFSYLKQSADIRRKLMNYQVSGDVETMARLKRTYGADQFEAEEGSVNDEAIFILGLPRTGSTLLERMIGSHSDVFAAGELQNFAVEFVKLAQLTFAGEKFDKLSLVEKSTRLNFKDLGERYVQSTRPRTGRYRHFIDKLPLNFLYVGLIAKALPNAKIIHLTRHPMDVGYAIYKTPFDQAYPYSYDLDDLGAYYVAYHKLMAHWREVLPGRVLDVAYEDLVRTPDHEIRRALDHCGLGFQESCLNFHESQTPTNTASAAQVRQPLYQSSVAKWRNVEKGLLPFRHCLEKAGIETGDA